MATSLIITRKPKKAALLNAVIKQPRVAITHGYETLLKQGCQMVCFQTKNPNLGQFWKVMQWKILVYFMDTWSILRSFVIFYRHLVELVVIWYIFPFWYFVPKKIWQPCVKVLLCFLAGKRANKFLRAEQGF
jgi:hypothetical protein